MHIVILGGTGFVGRHLAARLCGRGDRVTVLSRNRDHERLRGWRVLPKLNVVNCNVHDAAALTHRFQGADAVINLVGILNERGRSGEGFRRAHVELAGTVIGAMKAAGVKRLLQMSALNAGRGKSHYLRTRGEAEALVKASGLSWTIFQPSVIFGPGDGLFQRFAALLRLAPVLPLARPNARFAPVYVGDVVEAFARCLRDPASVHQSYELYGPDTLTLAEIVRYTARQMGVKRVVLPLPDALGRAQGLVFDFIPGKPFSTDNFLSLQIDAVGGIDGLYRLGIPKTPIERIVPQMLGGSPRQQRLARDRARPAP